MKRPRTLAIGALAFAIAFTPLGSILSGGVFETWLRSEYGRGPVRVLVHDKTGLVSGTATYSYEQQVEGRLADPRVLVVPWSVCGYQADLTLTRTGIGYTVAAPSVESGWCSWFEGASAGLTALSLRAPVEASLVDFEAPD